MSEKVAVAGGYPVLQNPIGCRFEALGPLYASFQTWLYLSCIVSHGDSLPNTVLAFSARHCTFIYAKYISLSFSLKHFHSLHMSDLISLVFPLQPPAKYLLPEVIISDYGKKCVVIDLDETLVHSSFKVSSNRGL